MNQYQIEKHVGITPEVVINTPIKELKIKSEYIGWKFEPELKNIKKLCVNGKELSFKVIEVEDNYDDGKACLTAKCEDAIVYVPTLCGLDFKIKLTQLIEKSKVFYK